MSACLLQSHGETIRGKGKAVFCPCFSFLFPLVVSPLHRYGRIKLICKYVRTCALRRKSEMLFLAEQHFGFKAACMIKFLVYLRYYYHLWDFEFSVQAALWIFLFVRCRFDYSYRKRTDFVGKRSLPLRQGRQGGAAPWPLPPLKRWTKLFTFVFICAGSFNSLLTFFI